MQLVVVGIGTDVGKTIVSSILVEKFKSNYWKPVQAGELDNSDSHKVERLADSCKKVFPEIHRLNTPASPHYAAELDGIQIHHEDFVLPNVGDLIIEAAGGLMVPLNEEGLLYVDIIQQWKIPVVLVSRHYLGSINHTLLSLEVLKSRGIDVFSVVFVGDEHVATESIIQKHYPELLYVRVPNLKEINSENIKKIAAVINL
jgi:dethiobiotin synthetase